MMKEQSEKNLKRKTTRATVAIDFETATATKIPTAGSGHGQRHGGPQTQRADPETNVDTDGDV